MAVYYFGGTNFGTTSNTGNKITTSGHTGDFPAGAVRAQNSSGTAASYWRIYTDVGFYVHSGGTATQADWTAGSFSGRINFGTSTTFAYRYSTINALVSSAQNNVAVSLDSVGGYNLYFGHGDTWSTCTGGLYDGGSYGWSGMMMMAWHYMDVPTAPGTPTVSRGGSSGQVNVSWSAGGGEGIDGYRVAWSTSSTFASTTGYSDPGASLSATISGLTPGVTYYFRVASKNPVTTAAGASYNGPYSGISAAVVAPGVPDAPSTTFVSRSSRDITFRVTADNTHSTVYNGYKIDQVDVYRESAYSTSGPWTQEGPYSYSWGSTEVSRDITHTNLTPGKYWRFWSYAHNTIGWGGSSSKTVSEFVPGYGYRYVNGVWQPIAQAYRYINGVWTPIQSAVRRNAGVWETND